MKKLRKTDLIYFNNSDFNENLIWIRETNKILRNQ